MGSGGSFCRSSLCVGPEKHWQAGEGVSIGGFCRLVAVPGWCPCPAAFWEEPSPLAPAFSVNTPRCEPPGPGKVCPAGGCAVNGHHSGTQVHSLICSSCGGQEAAGRQAGRGQPWLQLVWGGSCPARSPCLLENAAARPVPQAVAVP